MHPFSSVISFINSNLVPSSSFLYNSAMKWSPMLLATTLLYGSPMSNPVESHGRTASGPVGASMAVLATLQDADVLPPEGTSEANRVIQVVIQFQALFMKSSDPVVREFFDRALAAKWPTHAVERAVDFRERGWTSEIMEALCGYYGTRSEQDRARLADGFSHYNMRLTDFELLSELYGRARVKLSERGQDIHQVFTEYRRSMLGGRRDHRKERRDGHQSLYSHQS